MRTRLCAAALAAAVWALPLAAEAACEQEFRGTAAAETMPAGDSRKITCYWGRGGIDTFPVQVPRVYNDDTEDFDRVIDLQAGEVVLVPGTVDRKQKIGCTYYWHRKSTPEHPTSSSWTGWFSSNTCIAISAFKIM